MSIASKQWTPGAVNRGGAALLHAGPTAELTIRKMLAAVRHFWCLPIFPECGGAKVLQVGCVILGVLLCGCTTTNHPAQSAAPLVWPNPPDPPRITYVQSISRPADIGVKVSGGARFIRWLFGSNVDHEFMVKPFGLAFDENDNLCLTDTGANTVCFFDRTRKTWQRWDKVGQVRFSSPVSVAKRNGRFYVADSRLGEVIVFSEGGKLISSISNRLERPVGLAVHGDRLFVADSLRHVVVIFDLEGGFLSEFGRRGAGPGEFNFPTHVAADSDGNLLVTDSMNSRVQVFDNNGKFKAQLGSGGDSPGHFGRPKGLAVDSFGHIYSIDGLFDVVQIFDRQGRLLLNFGGSGSSPGEFWLANGVAINRTNEIYVADAYNRRVQVFRYVGGEL